MPRITFSLSTISAWLAFLLTIAVPPVYGQQPLHQAGVRVAVDSHLQRLLQEEDSDGDRQITVLDQGDKRFTLHAADGRQYLISDTHHLANLLQELALARQTGQELARLRAERIFESPSTRLSRLIRTHYWDRLTRRLDQSGLAEILTDPKTAADVSRLYVPHSDRRAWRYYRRVARRHPELNLGVVRLPEQVTPEFVQQLNDKPGLLSLALRRTAAGEIEAPPFVVPGGRFNEMYGWDSYFIVVGLLADGRIQLARSMVDHFVYQITHYGKILNANRTYYLTRSQPPFLTSMALAVYEYLPKTPRNKRWLARTMRAAISEYHDVWTSGKHQTPTGLSRYYGYGIGLPPETEPGHYDEILAPLARQRGWDIPTFIQQYQAGEVDVPELDQFLLHDRAMRESGHDTTYRLLGRAAHLNTVALNSLLYKYERDIARTIKTEFNDQFVLSDEQTTSSQAWFERADKRRELVSKFLWNEPAGMFYDYDFVEQKPVPYVSATTLYPLWAELASPQQAQSLVEKALPLLEMPGGIVSSTEASRGPISPTRPQRQWDHPYGWAPHQMIAWRGLQNYGYTREARRLAYRWLYTIALNASRFNGAIVEKYDVVHRDFGGPVEYGNVGTDFEFLPEGGFGWTNASFQVGHALLTRRQRKHLQQRLPPEWTTQQRPVVDKILDE